MLGKSSSHRAEGGLKIHSTCLQPVASLRCESAHLLVAEKPCRVPEMISLKRPPFDSSKPVVSAVLSSNPVVVRRSGILRSRPTAFGLGKPAVIISLAQPALLADKDPHTRSARPDAPSSVAWHQQVETSGPANKADRLSRHAAVGSKEGSCQSPARAP